tara:strand:- start:545 stop:1042 length:498 start_codon:yes stop_codon:yes gene_type:complete
MPDIGILQRIVQGFTTTAKAQIRTEVDDALDTAIPGSPAANSINERIKTIDDLIATSGGGDLAAILADTNEMQGLLPSVGPLASIKNIQKGATAINNQATSATTTITAVVTANSWLVFGGATGEYNDVYLGGHARLTDTTTVTVYRAFPADNATSTIAWTVVELY